MILVFRVVAALLLALFSFDAVAVTAVPSSANGALSFIERNEGQAHEAYTHVARVPAYTALLSADAALFMLPTRKHDLRTDETRPEAPAAATSVAMQMQLLGASENVEVTQSGLLNGRSNYLQGADPANWITGVAHYGKLRYAEVYPGIDLVYTLENNALRYDFIVSPDGDPAAIQLGFAGSTDVQIGTDGRLSVRTKAAELEHSAPVIYQDYDGEIRPVDGGFVALDDGSLRFRVAAHAGERELVIDPQISFSTLLGGSDSDGGQDIALDASGRMIIVGATASVDFPLADQLPPGFTGGLDIFVARLAADGQTLEFATYLGGSAEDNPHQVEVDADGNMVIAGYTSSPDFPVVNAAQPTFQGGGFFFSDGFIIKLAPDGASLVYSTYLGGSEPLAPFGGFEWIRSLVLDDQGNAFVTGETSSADFPATQTLNGRACMDGETGALSPFVGDAFVAKFTAAGGLEYAVCFGGEDRDTGRGIALGRDGTVHVAGFTRSANFPATPGAFQTALASPNYDGHVTHLAADGTAILSSTLVGGAGFEFTQQVRVAPDGSRVVIGSTASQDFPTTLGSLQPQFGNPAFGEDAALFRVSADASELLFSTFLGGFGVDTGWGLELDASGRIYVSGFTSSPDFPLKNALQTDLGGAASLSDSIGDAADATQAVTSGQVIDDGGLFGVVVVGNASTNRLYQYDAENVLQAAYNITEDTDDTRGIVLADTDFSGFANVIVAANSGVPSKVYSIDGPGSFTFLGELSGGAQPTEAVVSGFLPGSSQLDVVTGNYLQPNLYYPGEPLLGTGFGPGVAAFPGSETTATLALAVGDVNQDGLVDVIEGNDAQTNRVYLATQAGGFAPGVAVGPETDVTTSILVADFNGDFMPDVVAGNNGAPNRLYLNQGGGVFGAAIDLDPGAGTTTGLASLDVDFDGSQEIVAVDGGTGWLYINNGLGEFFRLPLSVLDEPTNAVAVYPLVGSLYLGTPSGTPLRALEPSPIDAFVAVTDIGGTELLFSSYFGGTGREQSNWGLTADGAGGVYLTGDTLASDFPTQSALQSTLSGISDAFVIKLDLDDVGGTSAGASYKTTLTLQSPTIDGIDRIELLWRSSACGVTALTDYELQFYAGSQLVYDDTVLSNGELQPVGTEPRDFPTWDFNYETFELEQFNTGADGTVGSPGAVGTWFLVGDNISLPEDGEVMFFKFQDGAFQDAATALLASQATMMLASDCDGDGVDSSIDNCTALANADQRDTDGDGYGNLCDADLNNDCAVNFSDLGALKSVFFSTDEDADLDGDGVVNFSDLGQLKALFFVPPGPSGVTNACGPGR